MKLIAVNEIHYTGKDGKPAVAQPGAQLDVPQALANSLLSGSMPAARRMTDAEIELDKLRAMAIAKGKSSDDEDDEDGDEDDDADKDGGDGEDKGETKKPATAAKTGKPAATKAASAKESTKDY